MTSYLDSSLLYLYPCRSTSTKIQYQLNNDLKRCRLVQGVTAIKTWEEGTNNVRLTFLQFLCATATMLQQ